MLTTPDNAVGQGRVPRLTRGGAVRLARVTAVAPGTPFVVQALWMGDPARRSMTVT